MRSRLFILLLVLFIFAGCTNKQPNQPSGATPGETAVPSLGVPMPTDEILSALGPENDIPIQRLLPNPLFAIVGKPKQFLASPISKDGEQLVSDIISEILQLRHVNPRDIERFVQSTGFPLLVPAPQGPDNPPSQQKVTPIARRATVITFNKSLDAAAMLRIDDPAVLASMKRTEGKTEYYDLTPPNFEGPLHVAFGLFGDKSAVFVEGTEEDVKAVFSDNVPKNAVLERLKHMPVDANELTVISSLEGLPGSPEQFEKLLGLFVQPGSALSNLLPLVKQNLRAVSLSMNVSGVGQPIISINVEGRDEKSVETIKDTIQGLILNAQTTVMTMSEEAKQTLPVPADFAASLLQKMTVATKGTQVHVDLENFATLIPTVAQQLSSAQTTVHQDRARQGHMARLSGHWALFFKYYQEHQKFPTDILDANGQPLLSWRVALLQSIPGGKDLYNKFKLDEPWNSEANLAILNSPDMKPAIFLPMTEEIGLTKTDIRFFDSAGTPFSKQDLKHEDIKATEDTSLMFVVVAPKYAVEWTKPEPLEFDVDQVADILGVPFHGTLQYGGITFKGENQWRVVVPSTDPQYDAWKQSIEAKVKVLPE